MQGNGKQEEADYKAEQEAEAQAQGESEQAEYERRKAEKEQKDAEIEAFMRTPQTPTSKPLIDESNFEREIRELKVLRENAKGFQEILKGLQVRFAEKHKNMIHSMDVTNEAIGKLEESIKTKALKQYEQDGKKKLAFGVGIRVMTDPFYDSDAGLAWAKETGLCLKLDVTAFKKIAKVQELNFVELKERPIATIPSEIKLPPTSLFKTAEEAERFTALHKKAKSTSLMDVSPRLKK